MAPQKSVWDDISLDVIERCLFWLGTAYVVSKVGCIFGFSCWSLFCTVFILGSGTVILIDKIKVDPTWKAVLITGCDTGFGNAVSKKLHELGYTVFAGVYSMETEGAKELQKAYSDRMFVFKMDVSSEEDVNRALEHVKNNLPTKSRGLWAVITNAGLSTFGEVEWTPLDVHKKITEVNLFGTIRTIKASLPLIRKAEGRVITISSMWGRFGAPSRSAYTSSKWAVQGFSECLRQEMKRWGVAVSVIEPGNFVQATGLSTSDALKQQGDHMWSNLSQEVKDDYGKEYFDITVEKMKSYTVGGACSIEPVLTGICNAVSHSFPQSRYQVMTPDEKVRCFIATHLPSIIYDTLYH